MNKLKIEKYKKLGFIYKECEEDLNKIAKKFADELRNDCNTYGEILTELEYVKKSILFNAVDKREFCLEFMLKVEKLINKEIYDLPIASHNNNN